MAELAVGAATLRAQLVEANQLHLSLQGMTTTQVAVDTLARGYHLDKLGNATVTLDQVAGQLRVIERGLTPNSTPKGLEGSRALLAGQIGELNEVIATLREAGYTGEDFVKAESQADEINRQLAEAAIGLQQLLGGGDAAAESASTGPRSVFGTSPQSAPPRSP